MLIRGAESLKFLVALFTERKARVDAVWQQMNKGVSAKTLNSVMKSSSVNKSAKKDPTLKTSTV